MTIAGISVFVNADDWLIVAIYTTQPTSGLVLGLRILTPACKLYYQQENLDGASANSLTRRIFKLTEGYLIGIMISDWGGNIATGACLVTAALQRGNQLTAVPHTLLCQGYVWYAGGIGAPALSSGTVSVVGNLPTGAGQSTSGAGVTTLQSNSAYCPSPNTCSVTFNTAVTKGSLLVANTLTTEGYYGATGVADNNGNTWTESPFGGAKPLWYAANANAGNTTVTATPAITGHDMLVHVVEIQGIKTTTPVDVSAISGGSPPQSVTTPSSSATDVLVVSLEYESYSTTPYQPQSGYSVLLDTNTGAANQRLITLLNLTPQAPVQNFSYSASGGTHLQVCLEAFKTAS
jgi:hypothetical protein